MPLSSQSTKRQRDSHHSRLLPVAMPADKRADRHTDRVIGLPMPRGGVDGEWTRDCYSAGCGHTMVALAMAVKLNLLLRCPFPTQACWQAWRITGDSVNTVHNLSSWERACAAMKT